MVTKQLHNLRVAVLVMDGVEEAELMQPVKALLDAGADVDVVSEHRAPIQAFEHHTPSIKITVDKRFADVRPEEYDAVLLPGGALNADALRSMPAAQEFVAAVDAADKPLAAICHAPWLLVSADLLGGRRLTSFHTLHDDIENAGGDWIDEAVVIDGNLLTSRQPADLPLFIAHMLELFASANSRSLQLS